jgi:3-dehydroquinate dehydratase type I
MTNMLQLKRPAVVGVISSASELRLASRLSRPPDLFELRLDWIPAPDELSVAKLPRPIIITSRHPFEGGRKQRIKRSDLLLRWLPRARFVDIEVRSLHELHSVLSAAVELGVGRIYSAHYLNRTPNFRSLENKYQLASRAGADLFKIVTRADSISDLLMLLRFLASHRAAVMAIGRYGQLSRLLFPECGSPLIYAPVRRPIHSGQLTLMQLRKIRDSYAKTEVRTRNLCGDSGASTAP